jgi:hypothetical protein
MRTIVGERLSLRRRDAKDGSGWVGCHMLDKRSQPLTQIVG